MSRLSWREPPLEVPWRKGLSAQQGWGALPFALKSESEARVTHKYLLTHTQHLCRDTEVVTGVVQGTGRGWEVCSSFSEL